jgi:hypothetical protein
MAPSEYSTLEFETRLAGYSDDDDEPSPAGKTGKSKHKRGESRDDAWVDILVANHSRRMEGQDVERGGVGRKPGDWMRGLKAGRSDPELASMEVAQALAGVRAMSPPSDDGEEEEDVTLAYRDTEYEHDEHGGERDRYRHHELELDPDVDSIMSAPTRRRMGYFDLHPERRPRKSDEEDPRVRLAEANSDEEGTDEGGPVYGLTPSSHSVPPMPLGLIEIPEFVGERNREAQVIVPPKRTTSKTAALIEMYREKEKESTPAAAKPPVSPASPVSPLPSKLPVRSSSLPVKTGLPAKPPIEVSAPSPSPPSSPPPSGLEEEGHEPALVLGEPPRPLEETGRSSPARYIHGAPLHNVLEEEEED